MSWVGAAGEDKVCGARSRSLKCIALLGSKKPRQSAMDFKGIRRLYLPLRPKGRFSPGRKTPPGISAPSAGLRPLIVSRVKCGGGPCRGHSVLPCTGNTICLQCHFYIIAESLISVCQKHVVAATGPSPFKVGDNQRPERTMSGVRKPSPESSVPGETLTGGKEAESILEGIWKPIRA